MTTTLIDSATLNQWLERPGELAVIDLRDPQAFGKWGAPLNAANVPLARLERDIGQLVPRTDTPLVLVDDDGDAGGPAWQAALQLQGRGYGQVRVLEGGFHAWQASGFVSSFSVTGNDYAEQIRQRYHTPSITAQQLQALVEDGRDVIVLDTRTLEEYGVEHVPGAVSVPGAELLQRYADLVPVPETLVVVSCALLARAILGAQTLINAGVPNRVVYLHEGTKGWRDAGFSLAQGATRRYGPASDEALDFARRKAPRLRLPETGDASQAQVEAWRRDAGRTTYLLDVRDADDYAAGHLDGALHAPGGQLILGTFRFLAVRGARLVLVDDGGARAVTTAHWLAQRGWEVHVHSTAAAAQPQAFSTAAQVVQFA